MPLIDLRSAFETQIPFHYLMKKFGILFLLFLLTAFAAWKMLPIQQKNHGPLVRQSRSESPRVANNQLALNERLKAAKEISTDLTNEDLKHLLAFLAKPIDARTGEDDFMAINEVMNQLRISGMSCGEYANALCSLIKDKQAHPVVRDYAIQHAGTWMKDAATSTSTAQISEEDRKHLLDCFVAFLQEPSALQETGYGTTLHMLRSMESDYPQETEELFLLNAPRIVKVAEGAEFAPLSNRVAAIQTLSALPDKSEARKLLRKMITEASSGSPVKLVSIATLGEVGDYSDLATLRQVQQSDSRLTYAASSAITRLESYLSASK